MSEGKILLAVVVVLAVMATNGLSQKAQNVRDICKYNIGGQRCSRCCSKARTHCTLYCKNMPPKPCNMADPNVCDVSSSNKYFMYSFNAKGCNTHCMGKKRTLENPEPSFIMSSPDICNTCVERALKSYRGTNPSVWIRQVCADVCLTSMLVNGRNQ